MTRVYYKDSVGAFIVYDVTRPQTFDNVQHWKNDIDKKITLPDGKPIPCVLLANKVITKMDQSISLCRQI
jgi:GTPase SAR1 family protein